MAPSAVSAGRVQIGEKGTVTLWRNPGDRATDSGTPRGWRCQSGARARQAHVLSSAQVRRTVRALACRDCLREGLLP